MYIFILLTYYFGVGVLELFKLKRDNAKIKNKPFYSYLFFYLLIILFQYFTSHIVLVYIQTSNFLIYAFTTLMLAYVYVNFIILYNYKIMADLIKNT
jgi:hypothetical protein